MNLNDTERKTIKLIKEQGLKLTKKYKEENLFKISENFDVPSFQKELEGVFEVLIEIQDVNSSLIPYSFWVKFANSFERISDNLADISSIPNKINSIEQIGSLKVFISNVKTHAVDLKEAAFPLIQSKIIDKMNFPKEVESNREELNKIIADSRNYKSEFIDLKEELNLILSTSKDISSKIGVSKYATVFENESQEHLKISIIWIIFTVLILISILFLGIFFFNITDIIDKEPSVFIKHAISKLVILSVLFYGLSLCNKNYKAHKHNAIVNKHRQNALTTFQAFSEAVENDPGTKNAILLQATQTIFGNQPTGYLKNEGDGESSNKIIEIIKGVTTGEP
ncbi:hypothetical protein [uncultured Aquimarina sp.]|uniref:hypothetical protein n=1 Tax=uncultured Aquimarina sp. TaxID=575652 RepID=UPI00262B16FF|nr:hypothetical protein [uncultured Aquimarina sp.]